jgi:outer membrane protein OmpA-like peptidoglycan-associated protein/tetratricopeptide (TPR) repeat protein
MKIFINILLITCVLFSVTDKSIAQENDKKSPCNEIVNKKALKLYEKGIDKKNKSLEEKVQYLKEAIELEPEYAEALYALADGQRRSANVKGTSYEPMAKNLEKVIEICPEYNPYAYFYLAQYYFSKEKYPETIKLLKKFLGNSENAKNDNDYSIAENILSDAEFYDRIINHPVPFNPEPVDGVSSQFSEYLAILSHDNEMCLFTRKLPIKSNDKVWGIETDQMAEVFMYSSRTDIETKFNDGTIFEDPFAVGESYGGATLSMDNKTMYVTVCKTGKMGRANCDIYTTNWSEREEAWQPLQNMGPNINTEDGWESQPSISSDGKTLIFATARAESRGIDLFYSNKLANGEWTKAKPLSQKLNTDGNEKTPFLHSDSHTLYFASDGHRGIGGYDIYFTRLNEKGEWSKPKNLGSPINTENDEYGFFVSLDGHLGYFASNTIKTKNKGGIDVYRFELYQDAKPEKVLLFKGQLKDESGEPVVNGKIEVKDPVTKEVTEFAVSPGKGTYAGIVRVPKDRNLIMTVTNPNSVPVITRITPEDSVNAGKKIIKNIEIKEAEVGKSFIINDIHYETNSSKLTLESLFILDELHNYLNERNTIKMSVNGHTDDVGDDNANLALSTDRAFSVVDYLHSKGIAKERLIFKGFGETKPISDNKTNEGRALNRRTEFVVLEK